MRRGEIWVANLNPARGRETGKIRPVLIMQADELGPEVTPLVVILPLSTQPDNHPLLGRLHLPLPARDRLLKPSLILADQPRTLDRSRLGEGPLTILRTEEMRAVERILRRVAGLS
jgi:mRNA interferase MazF